MINFESLLSEIDDFGIYQKMRYLLICVAALLPPIVTYMQSFIAPKLKHRCQHPYFANDSFAVDVSNYVGAESSLASNVTKLDECSYTINDTQSIKCTNWVYDKSYYQTTLTEELSMVCDYSSMSANVQTIYFSGYLVGSIVMGILADHFGRRPIMLSSFIMIILGSLGVAFGPQASFGFTISYTLYAVSRFIIACGTRGINVTGFVLGMEMMGPSRRTFAGIVIEYFFAFGQLILVLFAYMNNMLFGFGWRTLAIFLMLFTIPFLGYFFILPESPRWLMSKKRNDEALKIVENIAKTNKRKLNIDTWNTLLEHQDNQSVRSKESILDLFRSMRMFIISVILFLNWIINNFIFYGLGLKSSDLGVNPYMSFAISAFVEIIAYIISHALLDKLGRKLPYFVSLFTAGLACMSVVLTDNKVLVVVLVMLGKFCASASYAIIYLYSSELFPTSIRNSGMGACSMFARIGSMVAPLINELGNNNMPNLPIFLFGISGFIGSLTAIVLPETLNRSLPDNIKDANRVNVLGFSCTSHKETIHEEAELNKLNSTNNNE